MQRIKTRRTLRPLKLGQHSKNFFVFDVETGIKDKSGNIQYILSARPEHFLFGCIVGSNGFKKVIYTVEKFNKEFLKKRYKNKLVYAHNAEYDLSTIYSNIYLMDNNAIFNGKFICASNSVNGKPHARFIDSYNLLPTSVKKLGELLKIHKLDLGKNLVSHVNNINDDITYCFRDCEIVLKSLQKMFEQSEPSYTIGSHTVKMFRSKFLKEPIKVDQLADEFFECMYGGRNEAFKIGKCKSNVHDINSAYPYAMKQDLPNPTRLKKSTDIRDLYNEKLGGLIKCTVEIPDSVYIPALPLKHDGKLLFPVGTFSGCWTLNEFRYALKVAPLRIVKLDYLIVSPLIKSPFIEYIDTIYKMRLNTNDEFLKYRYKLEMNNLYGKLGQRLREEWKFFETEKKVFEYIRKNKIKQTELNKVTGGYFIKYDVDKIYNHTIPCWSAYITAHVRIMLHEFMSKHANDIRYCDTDSVFLDKDLKLNQTFLGGWKKENKTVTNIRALKDYVYIDENENENRMLKGVKKGAEQLTQDADVFQYKRMIKTRESLRRLDLLPPGTFIDQIKLLSGTYNKRIILKNGLTKPIKF